MKKVEKWEILKDIGSIKKGEIVTPGFDQLINVMLEHVECFPEYFKKIEDVQVGRAAEGYSYNYISDDNRVLACLDLRRPMDNRRHACGNYYLDQDVAIKARDRQQLITDMHRFQQELENGWVPDWSDVYLKKYYPRYDYEYKCWNATCDTFLRYNFLFPHFQHEKNVDKLIDHLGDRLNLLID